MRLYFVRGLLMSTLSTSTSSIKRSFSTTLKSSQEGLVNYLHSRVNWGLSSWQTSPTVDIDSVVTEVVEILVAEAGDISNNGLSRKRAVDKCQELCKAFRAKPGSIEILHNIRSNTIIIDEILEQHKKDISRNSGCGAHSMRTIKSDKVSPPRVDLVDTVYSWIERCLLDHFRRNGAKKMYIRNMHDKGEDIESDGLAKDLFFSGGKVRILDIGSQNNPLSRSDMKAFSVTPIFCRMNDSPDISQLLQSEHWFDAAVFPLSIATFPTPDSRREAIISASRRLLLPGSDGQPHRVSLLIIIEKSHHFGDAPDGSRSTPILDAWRSAMQDIGLRYIRHTTITVASDKCWGMVFALESHLSDDVVLNPADPFSLASDFYPPVMATRSYKTKRVGIVGGGIGGVALASLLQRRGIDVTVFEKDMHLNVRRQGYAVTMQQGVAVLRAMDIDIAAYSVASRSHSSYDSLGGLLGAYGCNVRGIKHDRKDAHNVHIPRQRLRELIIETLQPNTIQWGRKLVNMCESDDEVELTFSDGLSDRCAVVVAADGIHSSIRRELMQGSLQYLGLMVILGVSPYTSTEANEARQQKQWLDSVTRVFTMPFDASRTMWQMSYPCSEEAAISLMGNAEALLAEAKSRCKGWDPVLIDILQSTEHGEVSGHPAYDRDPLDPVALRNSSRLKSRITLIGDAAHPMSPFKGQGANQALLDSLSLADHLCASDLTIPSRRPLIDALISYEREMCLRSKQKVSASRLNARLLHGPQALVFGNTTRASAAISRLGEEDLSKCSVQL